jgi:hypothetical protein
MHEHANMIREVFMASTRRAQFLMEPEEYARLETEAKRRRISVAKLIRLAIHAAYFANAPEKAPIVEKILSMNLPTMDWSEVRYEIEAGHADLH